MARPNEIAADARALYGPPSVRPAAGAMGDGALWVDPGNNQALYQVQSGNWVRIALPDADDDSSVPAGVPVLRGPYVVDYTDIPHDGDSKVLWTPAVGDVLWALGQDGSTVVLGDVAPGGAGENLGGYLLGTAALPSLFITGSYLGQLPNPVPRLPYVFRTASPVQVGYADNGDGDLTAGHMEMYALVARAVAP